MTRPTMAAAPLETVPSTARPPRRRARAALVSVPALAALLALAACAGSDAAGAGPGRLAAAIGASPEDPVPVVVDTDLGADDLAALAFLLRHPSVEVRAVTVAGGGLVGCDPGVDIVADLTRALGADDVPVACTTASPGPGARAFPDAWRRAAAAGSGLPRADGHARPVSRPVARPATSYVARLARRTDGLVLVGLGPLTTPADLAAADPSAYDRLAGVLVMGGALEGSRVVDGVAEWNAAADPQSFRAVLAAPVPVTVVPADAVPPGTPSALADAPGVADVAAATDLPAWWDLAAAAALVTGWSSGEPGGWTLDDEDTGELTREGDGSVQVVRTLDADALDRAYAAAFGGGALRAAATGTGSQVPAS